MKQLKDNMTAIGIIDLSDMFHDDTFEGKTFLLCSDQEVYYVEHDNEFIKLLRSQIEQCIKDEHNYLKVKHLDLVYKGRYFDDKILEVQWD